MIVVVETLLEEVYFNSIGKYNKSDITCVPNLLLTGLVMKKHENVIRTNARKFMVTMLEVEVDAFGAVISKVVLCSCDKN